MSGSGAVDARDFKTFAPIHRLLSDFIQHGGATPVPEEREDQEPEDGAEPVGKKARKEEALPPGWEERISKGTGRRYYLHTSTGRSQWTRPDEAKEAYPPPAAARSQGNQLLQGPVKESPWQGARKI
eukprot:753262-Hanusia_phi.AAC.1